MKSSLNKKIISLTISDIHLLHARNTTNEIISNLNLYFSNDSVLVDVDIIYFSGDIFDNCGELKDSAPSDIVIWFSNFVRLCHKHSVIVRMLEGTPSHDNKQAKFLMSIAESLKYKYPINIKHIENLSIEKLEELNIYVLYVPDEWRHDCSDTLFEVRELLQKERIEQVDVAIMHGQFDFQMPEIAKEHIKHNSEIYSSLVKQFISIGHIHKQSHINNIYAQGSFDRLSHNEEEDKGYYKFTSIGNEVSAEFIVNKTAKTFKTYKCNYDDIEDIIIYLDKKLVNVIEGSYIRLLVNDNNPLLKNKQLLNKRFLNLNFTVDLIDKKRKKKLDETINAKTNYVPLIINEKTISHLLQSRIAYTDSSLVNEKINKWISKLSTL